MFKSCRTFLICKTSKFEKVHNYHYHIIIRCYRKFIDLLKDCWKRVEFEQKDIFTQKIFLKNALLCREGLQGLVDTSFFCFKQSSWALIWVNGDRNSNRDPTLSLLKSMLVCHNLIGVRMRPLMHHSHASVLLGSDSSSWPSCFHLCKNETN